ncbi:hypothetical protein ACFQ6N_34730 [Kitasatospora sp. NPDC056446]|uniref:hypothetical protein n=1 Tax=Kitasatospora sp. NPDC056446 TaxID=3345819 RepID=UPI0036B07E38
MRAITARSGRNGAVRRVAGLLALAVSAATAAGCGAATGGSATGGPAAAPAIGPVPVVTTVEQIGRPIDRYLVTPQQVATLQSAANALNETCMREFGLPPVATDLVGFDEASLRFERTHGELYGFFDPAQVAESGYNRVLPGYEAAAATPAAAQPSPATMTVEHGVDQAGKAVSAYAGRAVPAGGCKGESVRGTGGALPLPDPKALPDHGPRVPVDDPRIRAAFAAWSGCMSAKGYSYATPQDGMTAARLVPVTSEQNGVVSVRHSAEELKQAADDVACKLSTNLVGISLAVQSAYDTQYIESHGQALSDYRNGVADRVAAAERILRDAGRA